MSARAQFERFFLSSRLIYYKKGEILIRPEDTPQGVYFLQRGFVRFYAVSNEGEELTFLIFKPGEFFPVRFALTNEPIAYYYETMTPVELRRAATESFRTFLKENPDVLYEITGSILSRLKTVFERMQYLAYGNAYEKVASILCTFAEEYGMKEREGIFIPVPLTHKDIASLIGMSRETVSVEMSQLTHKGIITHKGRQLFVNDLSRLRKESLLKSVS